MPKITRKFTSAVILAGGKSTRMGFDKQLLQIKDRFLVEHLIEVLQTRFSDIMISSPTPELYDVAGVRVIRDVYEGVGPLGGIHAALRSARSEAVFVIACDMPHVEVPYIDYMMGELQKGRYDACVTRRGDHLEVFHSFFLQTALPSLEEELNAGRYSVQRFVKKIDALVIPEEVAAAYLPEWRAFTNLNTPEEYAAFRARWQSDRQS